MVWAGGAAQLVRLPAAALRSGPGAGPGRPLGGLAARPRRSTDVGHQRRLPAARADVPGQHRPALPAGPGGGGQLILDLGTLIQLKYSFAIWFLCIFKWSAKLFIGS